MTGNPDMLVIPTRARVVPEGDVERLEQRRKEREQELKSSGWTPKHGWLTDLDPALQP